jgi:hypothetical protein
VAINHLPECPARLAAAVAIAPPIDRFRLCRRALELKGRAATACGRPEGKSPHFQVSLDGLMGRRKELQEWDRAFERADGDAGPAPLGD